MTSPASRTTPQLDRPGAGLPFLERFLARYWALPRFYRATSWDQASALFQNEGERLLKLAGPLDPERLHHRVLIERIRGIEDSSRFWSPEMVLEHLIIVGSKMLAGIVMLGRGEVPTEVTDVASVKPSGVHGDTIIAVYREFLRGFAETTANQVRDRNSTTTYDHPWFGAMTAHQWHCLAGAHQAIHRKQLQRILAAG